MIIGLFPMVADLLHPGHLLALEEAKKYCDKLVVAFNVKPDNKEPVESVYERFVRLYSCKFVDLVIPYKGEADLNLICQTFEYNVRFIGSDHDTWTGQEYEIAKGIASHTIDRIPGWSSTDLKNRIKK